MRRRLLDFWLAWRSAALKWALFLALAAMILFFIATTQRLLVAVIVESGGSENVVALAQLGIGFVIGFIFGPVLVAAATILKDMSFDGLWKRFER